MYHISMQNLTINQSNISNSRERIKSMTYIALFTCIITVCSWISIPMEIPITLQTFAVFATLLFLGGKRGTITILTYILLGIIGVPVFQGFKSGMGVLVCPTGGYIVGFLLQGLIYWIFEKIFNEQEWAKIVALVLGLIVCYTFGSVWFQYVYLESAKDISILGVLTLCVFPFIIPDSVKLIVAYILYSKLKNRINI